MVRNMASQMILSKKDPGIGAMIAGWVDNEEYDIGPSRIRQLRTEKDQVFFDIIRIDEGGEAVLDDAGPPAKPPPVAKQPIPINYRK